LRSARLSRRQTFPASLFRRISAFLSPADPMLFDSLTTSGSIPTLEKLYSFTASRHRLISHNIDQLRDAVARRRAETGGMHGDLTLNETSEVKPAADGRLVLTPTTPSGNILYHDRSNRDLEKLMQDLVENTMTFRMASDLLRSRFELLRAAIAERA
jgi:flagellar basal-body rod protein FlgB